MLEAIVGILGVATIGSLGWAYSLGNQVAELKTTAIALAKSEEDFRDFLDKLLDAKFTPINQRLERIERGMNGALKGH